MGVDLFLPGRSVGLNFQIEGVAEVLKERLHPCFHPLGAVRRIVPLDQGGFRVHAAPARHAGGGYHDVFGVEPHEQLCVHPRPVIKPGFIGLGQHFVDVLHPCLVPGQDQDVPVGLVLRLAVLDIIGFCAEYEFEGGALGSVERLDRFPAAQVIALKAVLYAGDHPVPHLVSAGAVILIGHMAVLKGGEHVGKPGMGMQVLNGRPSFSRGGAYGFSSSTRSK